MPFICINSVFEAFAANIVIYSGFLFARKIECNYAITEFMMDLGYSIIVLIIFGAVFDWFHSTPVWMLIIIAFVVYAAGIFLSMLCIRKDIEEINMLLTKRNNKSAFREPQNVNNQN